MPQRTIHIAGTYEDVGVVLLENGTHLAWQIFDGGRFPRLPFGTAVSFTIRFQEMDFLNGSGGVVWASFHQYQVQTICDALRVLGISVRAEAARLADQPFYLIRVLRSDAIETAIDFIWRSDTGMRLQPDWYYPRQSRNSSFQKWVQAR
ncbi:MAG: hypothetical protein D6715_11565 [Calditrichaeota bacterium]|nr:MAG: hypothetical protein D6715_11565 [Calditrichota bacterium]